MAENSVVIIQIQHQMQLKQYKTLIISHKLYTNSTNDICLINNV